MRETEITVQVLADLDTILAQLQALGFTKVNEYELHDWYFTSLPTVAKIDYPTLMKHSFLVREVTGADTKVKLCYKDKEIDAHGNVVSEARITAPIADLTATLKIFRAAKLNHWCALKQAITVFRQGTTEFELQVVEGLGIFIEYEANDTMADLSPQAKIDLMYGELKKLNLPLGDDLSCKKVYLKYLAANN